MVSYTYAHQVVVLPRTGRQVHGGYRAGPDDVQLGTVVSVTGAQGQAVIGVDSGWGIPKRCWVH